MPTADSILKYALAQLGKPYKLGGGDDSAFDCSELTMKAYATAGIKFTHKAATQQTQGGFEVGLSGALPGDLVFFQTNGSNAVTNSNGLHIGHVAIYVGNGMVLEAPRKGDVVRIRPIGNRASRVVSVKRYVAPSTAPIVVPPSPYNGMHGGPGGGVPYVIPAGSTGPYGASFGSTSQEVAPSNLQPSPNPYGSRAPTGATLPSGAATLNATQIAQVAYAAGFRGEDLTIAVAVAMGESGGNIQALNPKGEHSVGLWQINRDAHGDRFGGDQALYDPYINAQAAFALYQERGFKPWTVYTRGIYKNHFEEAQAAVNQALLDGSIAMPYSTPSSGGAMPSVYDPVTGMVMTTDPTEMAKELYGYLAAYLDHPEIGPKLKEAAAEGWSPAKLEAELMMTEWWQTTGASKRQWDAAEAQDPKSAEEQIAARTVDVYGIAEGMGVDLKAIEYEGRGNVAMHLARQSLVYGWSEAQLQDAIGAEILRDPTLGTQVREGLVGNQIRNAAADFGVPLSDTTLDQYARQIAAGTVTMENFKTYLKGQAKAQYGDLGGALDRGETVRQVADPYLQIAGQMLGVDPAQMALNDPKWMTPLTFVDEKGVKRLMNYDEWMSKVRADKVYGYGDSETAKQKARGFVTALGSAYGKAA